MTSLYLALIKLFPFIDAFAAGDKLKESNTISQIVGWVAGIGGGIVAIFLVVSLVKDGIGLAKGSGDSSILKIVAKALFLLLIIGLIFVAVNYFALGKSARDVASKTVNTVTSEAKKAWN